MELVIGIGCAVAGFFVGKKELAYSRSFNPEPARGLIVLVILAIAISFIPFVGQYVASLLAGVMVGIVVEHLTKL